VYPEIVVPLAPGVKVTAMSCVAPLMVIRIVPK